MDLLTYSKDLTDQLYRPKHPSTLPESWFKPPRYSRQFMFYTEGYTIDYIVDDFGNYFWIYETLQICEAHWEFVLSATRFPEDAF